MEWEFRVLDLNWETCEWNLIHLAMRTKRAQKHPCDICITMSPPCSQNVVSKYHISLNEFRTPRRSVCFHVWTQNATVIINYLVVSLWKKVMSTCPKDKIQNPTWRALNSQILGSLNIKIRMTVMDYSSINLRKSVVHSYNKKGKRWKEISLQKHSR